MDDAAGHALARFQGLRRALLAVAIAGLFAALLFGQSALAPHTPPHDAIVLLGHTLIFTGIIGRLWSTLYIGGRKKRVLVSDGPYSVTRNPLYFFSAIAAAGVGGLTGSISVMIGLGVFCAAAFHVVILREEQFLTSQIGPDYEDYLERVPRFLPKWWLYREADEPTFRPRLLKKTLFDSCGFIVAVPVLKVVEYLQADGLLPVLFKLP